MFQKIKLLFLQILPVVIATLFVVAIIYAWTEPPANPPSNNVAAPINIGNVAQRKAGPLGVGGVFRAESLAIFDNNVGIGTMSPTTRLDVIGAIRIGTQDICNAQTAGAIRYVAATQCFQGCNGSSWMTIQCIAPVVPIPTVSISASPNPVTSGGTTTLTWNSTNATSCTATAGPGFSTEGAISGNDASTALTSTTTFTVSCTGVGGTNTASVIVAIAATPAPPPPPPPPPPPSPPVCSNTSCTASTPCGLGHPTPWCIPSACAAGCVDEGAFGSHSSASCGPGFYIHTFTAERRCRVP